MEIKRRMQFKFGKIFVSFTRQIRIESWSMNKKIITWFREQYIAFLLKVDFSGPPTYPSDEVSHSDSSNHQIPFKSLKTNGAVSTSRFKGVVSQQNGHWGAQIYANHQRIWLGTFKSERDAALAYDSAAIKLRSGDSHRNFPWTDITVHEPNFQSQFSTDLVLSMIKDGSYASKLSDYLRAQVHDGYNVTLHGNTGIKVKQLFQKELTPSDVSKLNRLVIPKKYAVKFFPRFSDLEEQNQGSSADDVELVFFDRSMRSWKFRYCYWKSSQSFVFTRGWNRFAKERGLRPKDRVIFSTFECSDGLNEVRKLCMIDVAYNYSEGSGRILEDNNNETALQLKIGPPYFDIHHGKENVGMDLQADFEQSTIDGVVDVTCEDMRKNLVPNIPEKKGFKLFGVQIF